MRVRRLGLVASVFAFATIVAQGCGGSSSTEVAGDDGGDEASTSDGGGSDVVTADGATTDATGNDAADASDAPSTTDAADAADAGDASDGALPDGAACGADNTACNDNGAAGLCKANACGACTDVTDDSACTSAYATPSLCISGACAPGDCRSNADCVSNANGTLCGVSTPNTCGKCTQDGQCGAGQVCNTTTGACVAAAAQCGGVADNGTCPVNGADVCCAGACIPGNCCSGSTANTFCQGSLSNNAAVCSAHVCTTCNPVSGLVYLVDPVNGNDGSATGSGTSGGAANTATPSCAFKTITRALQVIGATPAAGTTIKIVSTAGGVTVNAGEIFPIKVPTGTTITTQGGPVTVSVPAGHVGFSLLTAGSALLGSSVADALTIDGAAHTAYDAVVVGTGSTDGTKLGNVVVQNFLRDGIVVTQNGRLKIGPGVSSRANGTATARASGLHVSGTALVNIAAGSGEATIAFNENTAHGIVVDGKAAITLAGVAGTNGAGTIVTNQNYYAGLVVDQTPGVGLPENSVEGLVAWANTPGNGIRVNGGSNFSLRSSLALANGGSGVVVATKVTKLARVNTVTNIDLGTAGEAGHNTLQAVAGSNPNVGAGVCLQLDPGSGTLSARGNVFSGHDCSAAAATLTAASGCGGQRDLGGVGGGNDVDVTLCTH